MPPAVSGDAIGCEQIRDDGDGATDRKTTHPLARHGDAVSLEFIAAFRNAAELEQRQHHEEQEKHR